MRIAAAALLLIVLVFGALELLRWRQLGDGLLTVHQKRRRVLGLVLLTAVLGMAYGGSYLPSSHLSKVVAEEEALYWLACLLISVFIPLVAFFELKDSLRRSAEQRRKLYSEIVTAPLQSLDKAPTNGHHPISSQAPSPGAHE